MTDRKLRNTKIFNDTIAQVFSNPTLRQAVTDSTENQIFISEKSKIRVPAPTKTTKATVVVNGKRSLEASENYAKQGKRVCVLNFASSTTPGGGVLYGSSAQEESICRCSTLYPCLNTDEMQDLFYDPHYEAHNPIGNADCIYTPNVCVLKGDTDFPESLPEKDWWKVDIITCAAPDLRHRPSNVMNPLDGDTAAQISTQDFEKLITQRIRRIFEIAAAEKNDVLILGAFGCGAFKNPPQIVAKVFYDVMQDFLCHFDVIEYAVFHMSHESINYEAFCNAML